MADARSIILHEYPTSPYAEKIRLALRLKNLAWSRVEIPVIMPRPDLMPLTGGYRRTPVMQIGADIYCDTAIILRELEARYPMPALKLPGHEGLAQMVAGWTDGRWFQSSVAVIFGEMGDKVGEEFKKDREKLSGRPFDVNAMKAVAPMMRDQWRARLMLLEHGHCLQRHALRAFPDRDIQQDDSFSATSLPTLISMVSEGLGITLLPDLAIDAGVLAGQKVNIAPLADACPRHVILAWRPTSARKPVFRALAQIFRDPRDNLRQQRAT